MAEKIKLKASKNSRGSPLDTAMAAFAAASVAFVTCVMPADLLGRVIMVSSQTGRAALSFAAALATFIGVKLLLGALSKAPGGKPVEVVNEPPRLRRADMHPDAPARTPILAGRELGVPLDDMSLDERAGDAVDLDEVENVDYEAEWERPLPGFIENEAPREVEDVVAIDASDDGSRDAAEPAAEADLPFWVPEDASADEVVEEIESAGADSETPEPIASSEPAAVPFWVDEPEAETPEVDELVLDAPEPPPPAVPQEHHELDELGQRLPKKQALDHESIDGLVERFETGVGRRKRAGWTAGQSAPASEEDQKLEQRLRGAISELRKMSRG
jgi:hypothetical protein